MLLEMYRKSRGAKVNAMEIKWREKDVYIYIYRYLEELWIINAER